MKKTIFCFLIIILIFIVTGCSFDKEKTNNYSNNQQENKVIYTINTYDKKVQGNNRILIGKKIPKGIKQYKTGEEARKDFSNSLFCFKHKIRNGKVKESYIEFIITKDMANTNQAMVEGIYTLKGYEKDYENNKKVLLKSFGESYCKEETSYLHCYVDGFYANSFKNGYVEVGEGYWNCYITDKGISRCDFGK